MSEGYDSLLFQQYELIPRLQTLQPPIPDRLTYLLSKPIPTQQIFSNKQCISQLLQKQSLQQTLRHHQKQLAQQSQKMGQLTKKVEQKNKQCLQYIKLFQTIKTILGKPSIQYHDLIQQINHIIIHQKNYSSHHLTINPKIQSLQSMLLIKQNQIRNLKTQLYQSTANNINSLFDLPLNQDQYLLKQIGSIKHQVLSLKTTTTQKPPPQHDDKIYNLIKDYQQMLNIFNKNSTNYQQLKTKQQQYFSYLSTIKSQMNQSIQQKCSFYSNLRMSQLQNKIKQIILGLNTQPQKVKYDQQHNYKVKQLINQIQNLNQRIIQRQIQVQKLRQTNQQMMAKNRQYQVYKIKFQSLGKLQIQLKQKDRRIQQLQNTIIQHIDSKSKQQSNTSIDSDLQKNKNIIRNLKVIITKLKQDNLKITTSSQQILLQNKQLKNKLTNLSHQTDYLDLVQRVNKDQQSFKIIQQILTILINEIQNQSSCKCLNKITDHLLHLYQNFPQIQLILQQLCLIQKTSSLIPINDHQN